MNHTRFNSAELACFFQYSRNQVDFYYKILVGIFAIGFVRHLFSAKKFNYYIKLVFNSVLKKIKNKIY